MTLSSNVKQREFFHNPGYGHPALISVDWSPRYLLTRDCTGKSDSSSRISVSPRSPTAYNQFPSHISTHAARPTVLIISTPVSLALIFHAIPSISTRVSNADQRVREMSVEKSIDSSGIAVRASGRRKESAFHETASRIPRNDNCQLTLN